MASMQTSRMSQRATSFKFIQSVKQNLQEAYEWLRSLLLKALSSWPSENIIIHTSYIPRLPDIAHYISRLALDPSPEMYRTCIIGVIRTLEKDILQHMEASLKVLHESLDMLGKNRSDPVTDNTIRLGFQSIRRSVRSMADLSKALRNALTLNDAEDAIVESCLNADDELGTPAELFIDLALRKGIHMGYEDPAAFFKGAQKYVLHKKYEVLMTALEDRVEDLDDLIRGPDAREALIWIPRKDSDGDEMMT